MTRIEQVLDRLAVGDREAAMAALAEIPSPKSPARARLLDSLRRVVEGGRAPDPGGELPPDATPDERSAWVLDRATLTATALREGRIEDLVAGARAIQREVDGLHPYLLLRTASLLQAAFRFTADASLFDEARAACTRLGNRTDAPEPAVVGRALLASIYMMAGRLHAAMGRATAAVELAEVSNVASSPAAALALQFQGYIYWEWNRTDEAKAALHAAWERTSEGSGGIRSGVARVLSMIEAAQGQAEASDRWFARLEAEVTEPMTLRNREWLAAVRLTRALLLSRTTASSESPNRTGLREVDRWRRSWSYDDADSDKWTEGEVRARVHELSHALLLLELTGQWEDALRLATRVADGVGPLRAGMRLRAQTVQAVALENLGRSSEADERWREALVAGEPEGFVRSYIEGSHTRARLQRRTLDASPDAGPARRVSEASGGWPSGSFASAVELTPRQKEVLERIAEGDSNRKISERLAISETTVKTHVRDLLSRLGAGSRTQAVAIARRRGLL